MGGQNIILVEILEWVGDVTFVVKNWMEKVGGGGLCEILSVVGVRIFSGTTHWHGALP